MTGREEHGTIRRHPDFPDEWGAPLGGRDSDIRSDWVRRNVEMRTAAGRADRLRQLDERPAALERLASIKARVSRFR